MQLAYPLLPLIFPFFIFPTLNPRSLAHSGSNKISPLCKSGSDSLEGKKHERLKGFKSQKKTSGSKKARTSLFEVS